MTVISALLYYFGYVSTRAQFAYFGVDVDQLGLSTSDFLLQSASTVYFPILVCSGAAMLAILIHVRVSGMFRVSRCEWLKASILIITLPIGAALVLRGIVGLLSPSISADEPIGLTPSSLGLGVAIVAYGRFLSRERRHAYTGSQGGASGMAEALILSLIVVFIVAALFWDVNSFAAAYGRGHAERLMATLSGRPEVTLDSVDRLFVEGAVLENRLPTSAGQRFNYRYSGLRLLYATKDRLVIVPDAWTPSTGVALILQPSADIRLQQRPGTD